MSGDDYSHVPSADPDAVIDPNWSQQRSSGPLPTTYMPPAMGGPRSPVIRVVALVLIGIFVTASAVGVCLTYGPPGSFG